MTAIETTPTAACCSRAEQEICCLPEDKAQCCGATGNTGTQGPGNCGCR